MKKFTIALAGNPNCGKTTLFNSFTGSKQRVGNWPGVTVERKEGDYKHLDCDFDVIDLPGIYSFSAYSLDEKVSREYILTEKPDLVVNIVDATNLERNLYLTTQILEMKIPVILALNMMDLARQRKIRIEIEHLAEHLGCTVIPIVASKNKGFDDLKDAINEAVLQHKISPTKIQYDSVVEDAITELNLLNNNLAENRGVDSRWLSLKLLEEDELADTITNSVFDNKVKELANRISTHTGDETDIVIADGRYGFIHGLCRDVVHRDDKVRKNVSDIIDKIALNRLLGVPIFLAIMYLVFMVTINLGGAFIDFFDIFFGTIFVDGLSNLLTNINLPQWLVTLLAGGIGGGIQTVATFVPPIFFMFLSLSILEDSGYMSRAAFVMDRFMRFIGLPGKSFIPMLVGFGCTVPAIMGTRVLENRRDRILTILMNPFMSCGARLPVYVLFATAFFPRSGGLIVFSIYFSGIILAILSGLLFKKTILKGEISTFVMELPPYHIPTFNGIFMHTWQKLKSFILRAGQVIIIVVIMLSFLNSIGPDGSFGNEDSQNSMLSSIGKAITPIFHPMGISDENWPATVGLFTGIFAKEAVVGTLDNLYSTMYEEENNSEVEEQEEFHFWGGISEAFVSIKDGLSGMGSTFGDPMGVTVSDNLSDLEEQSAEQEVASGTFTMMREKFGNQASAYAYLLFILIYMPCVAAIAAVYRETNLKWTIFSVAYLTILAWLVSTIFYQISQFSLQPAVSAMWIGISAVVMIASYLYLKFVKIEENV